MRLVPGYLLIGLGFYLALISCQGNSISENSSPGLSEDIVVDTTEIPLEKVAICVWDVAGLRVEPGNKQYTKDKKNNYVESVYYGEKVEMLGEEIEIEGENRNYMKIRLQDGQEGWVHDYVFEKNATLAAVVQEAELYRRPDIMTLRDDKIELGEIVVTMERQGDWIHVSGREKRKKGWIKTGDNLSFNTRDVKLALLYYKALQEKTETTQKTRLNEILNDKSFSGSVLLDLIRSKVEPTPQQN
ncbi:MAG: hypothetical protein SF052_16400 [Bacteroidia bacterium]|nr:hypothetical protein [Bacteroidia bacterium]